MATTAIAPSTSAQTDQVYCNGKPATIVGTPRNDDLDHTIYGTSGDDVIQGLAGSDEIHAGGGNDLICGGGDGDYVLAGEGNDHVIGGPGGDALTGEGGRDLLRGNRGDDGLYGGEVDELAGDVDDGVRDVLRGGLSGNGDRCYVQPKDVAYGCERSFGV